MTEINSYVDLKWLLVVEKFRHEAKINDDARDAGLNPLIALTTFAMVIMELTTCSICIGRIAIKENCR